MAIREELVTSAVSFLQDPSVASAAIDKKVAFLESKNLTKEEVDAALARIADPSASSVVTSTTSAAAPASAQGYQYARQAPLQQQQQGFAQYPQGYWQQPPPPELPKRDWRDWFIMATVLGGVGYGLYFTAKRYILPKIAPPTPDQIAKDKAEIDSNYEKAFALLDQLSTDTTALKTAEDSRTVRLDSALNELEIVLSGLKDGDRKREDDARRNTDEIRSLRDLIPQALEQQKRTTEERLKDLGSELRSLKTLVGNRMAAPPAATPVPAAASGLYSSPAATSAPAPAVQPIANGTAPNGLNAAASSYQPPSVSTPSASAPVAHKATLSNGSNGTTNGVNGSTSYAGVTASTANPVSPTNASSSSSVSNGVPTPAIESSSTAAAAAPERSASSFGNRFGSGKAAIPAWQLAAAKNKPVAPAASVEAASEDKASDAAEASAA